MSPYLNLGVPNPLSVVTLASFQDLGYEQVDLTLADEFELPTVIARSGRRSCAPTQDGR